jgi:hypothetical protein
MMFLWDYTIASPSISGGIRHVAFFP